MARYHKEHKQLSRERIIDAAGRRLKSDGIDGSGVATLMKDAGLTNGAFYGHFESKDDLVRTVLTDQLRGQRVVLAGLAPGRAGLEQFVRAYLSVQHRDDVAGGCPTAALLDEIARCTDQTRQAYDEGVLAIIDDLASRLDGVTRRKARVVVLAMFAAMVGTIQLSRALRDRRLADAVLEQGIDNALALLGSTVQTPSTA